MKTLRSKLLLILLILIAGNLFAQKNLLVGKWTMEGQLPPTYRSVWKVFTDKGEFYNQRNLQDFEIRTHRGTYEVKDENTLTETVATPTHPLMVHIAGQVTTIEYRFSEDKKKLFLTGLATNGNTNWSEVWIRIDDSQMTNSNLPELFKNALKEAKMSFNTPPGTVEIPIIKNMQMHYEYAVKHQDFPLEVRYSISPIAERMKQALARSENGAKPEEIRKKENDHSKAIAYAVALNVGGGVLDTNIRSNNFPPGSVKLEFGADWGTTTLVNIKNNSFGTEYKCCMMVTLHRDDIGDAYVFYLTDSKETLMEAMSKKIAKDGSFYALKFDE